MTSNQHNTNTNLSIIPPNSNTELSNELSNENLTQRSGFTGMIAKVYDGLKALSESALLAFKYSLQSSLESLNGSTEVTLRNASNEQSYDRQLINDADNMIKMALKGYESLGLHPSMPPGTLYGKADNKTICAYWAEVISPMKLDEVANMFKERVPCPEEVDVNDMTSNPDDYSKIYLAIAASQLGVDVIDRAISLLPKYATYAGATSDPEERKNLNPAVEIEKLNKIFSEIEKPNLGQLQVLLVETESYGILEITRFSDFIDQNLMFYTIGKEGASYSVSDKNISNLNGLLPDLAFSNPRFLSFPKYSDLITALEDGAKIIDSNAMSNQPSELPKFPPSGPSKLIYCSYEAQQSLEKNVPGKWQAQIDLIGNEWNHAQRFKVYLDAARSADQNIREFGTTLLACYECTTAFLLEALEDRSTKVICAALQALVERQTPEINKRVRNLHGDNENASISTLVAKFK
jgi:hypothetical protein